MQKRSKSTTSSRRGVRPAGRARSVKPRRVGRTIKLSARRQARRPASARKGARTAPGRAGANVTTDREKIIRWTEGRGGHPATVIRTARKGEPGVLRIDFPGYSGEGTLKTISWDEWFRKFEKRNLAFLYLERTAAGKPSRFFKLVNK